MIDKSIVDEIDCAIITEKGIKYSKHRFEFKEKKEINGKMEDVTVSRLCEKNWLLVDDGRSYVSHQGPERFEAVCFNADGEQIKAQAENLRQFLLDYMNRKSNG